MNLQRVIGRSVTQIPIGWVQENKRSEFNEVNDSRIIYDVTFPWHIFGILILVLVGITFVLMLISGGMEGSAEKKSEIIYFFVWCILLSFLPILYNFIQPRKKLIFDRENQKVTIPRPLYYKSVTVPWASANAVVKRQIRQSFTHSKAGLRPPHKGIGLMSPAVTISITEVDKPQESWSFWLWYMDKNRPLPPSTSLDLYREQEIRRLKQKGFPAPKVPCALSEIVVDKISYPTGTPCEGVWPPTGERRKEREDFRTENDEYDYN